MKKIYLAADGIVLREGKLVLVYRKKEPKGWALPGGHVELEEKLKDACRREVKEETGLEIKITGTEKPSGEFGIYDDPERDPRKRMISVVFVCEAVGGELKAGSDAERVDLFSPEEALSLDLEFDHRQILEDFLESDSDEILR